MPIAYFEPPNLTNLRGTFDEKRSQKMQEAEISRSFKANSMFGHIKTVHPSEYYVHDQT
jgi:hypothetical protein